jgi:hypothetical protein
MVLFHRDSDDVKDMAVTVAAVGNAGAASRSIRRH